MKDPLIVIDDVFNQLLVNTEQNKIRQCFHISSECVRFAEMLDNDKFIFIFEIFESVFSQIGPILDNYEIPDDISKEIKNNIYESIKEIQKYSFNDVNEYLISLQKMRVYSTKMQLYCYRNFNPRE